MAKDKDNQNQQPGAEGQAPAKGERPEKGGGKGDRAGKGGGAPKGGKGKHEDSGAAAEALKPSGPPRLKTLFDEKVRGALAEQFGIKNPMAQPRLEKITINVNMGRHLEGA
jgi:large subunit ribosomal protein L5